MELSPWYYEAVTYASILHRDQLRKGTAVPYMSHLLGVSSLVLDMGGTEDEAIAALLHDAIEDQGHRTSLPEIDARYGPEVARIVGHLSEANHGTAPWIDRKREHLRHVQRQIEVQDWPVARVHLADKIQNIQTLLPRAIQQGVDFERHFNAPLADQLAYYEATFQCYIGTQLEGHALLGLSIIEKLRTISPTTLSAKEAHVWN